jgi:hypothetical protein
MQGAVDLLESERGIFCLLALVAVTVLAALSVVTGADWLDFAKWLTVTLVGSKTITTAVDSLKGNTASKPAPPSTP